MWWIYHYCRNLKIYPWTLMTGMVGRQYGIWSPRVEINKTSIFQVLYINFGKCDGNVIWQDSSDLPLDLPEILQDRNDFLTITFGENQLFQVRFCKSIKKPNPFYLVFLFAAPPRKLQKRTPNLRFFLDFPKVYQWHFALNDFLNFQWHFTVYLSPQHFVNENR